MDLSKKQVIQLTVGELEQIIEDAKAEVGNSKAINFLNIKTDKGAKYLSIDAALYLLQNPDCKGYSVPIGDNNTNTVIRTIECIN